MRLLLAEDDALLIDGLRTGLGLAGHRVDVFSDGVGAQQALLCEPYDVAILDLGLPRKDGMEVLKTIRNRQVAVPILVLTARDGVSDRVDALDFGADDYLVKPFDLGELLARLRALHRRAAGRSRTELHHGALILDPCGHRVTLNGVPVDLPGKEFLLLEALLNNAGRVLTRTRLEQTLYGWDEGVESNALEVHIHNLRRKLGKDLIHTVRGVGYLIRKPPAGE